MNTVEQLAEASAFILSEAGYVRAVARKAARKGAPVEPDEFEQELIVDVLESWWQIYTYPKTGESRPEPLNQRVFAHMRARLARLRFNRRIERERKSVGVIDSCTGMISTKGGDSFQPKGESLDFSWLEKKLDAKKHTRDLLSGASPTERFVIQSVLRGDDQTKAYKRTGLQPDEREQVLRSFQAWF